MEGRFEEARGLNERARRIFVEEMRARRMLMFVAQRQATVELLAGDLAAAERELCTGLEFARESGERDHISQTAGRLAFVLRAQGRSDEAASFGLLSAQTAPVDGVAAQALSRAAMAGSALDAGEDREAARLAREAVGLVPDEMLNLRGRCPGRARRGISRWQSGARREGSHESSCAPLRAQGEHRFGGTDAAPLNRKRVADDETWSQGGRWNRVDSSCSSTSSTPDLSWMDGSL